MEMSTEHLPTTVGRTTVPSSSQEEKEVETSPKRVSWGILVCSGKLPRVTTIQPMGIN